MKLKIVNRKYIVGGKWLRFEVMRGFGKVGYKVAVWHYELRIYLK
jgi:hypothetical protein